MGNYSSGDVAALPSGVDDLEHIYDEADLAAVATAGDASFVSQSATGEIAIHQYKDTETGQSVDITWTGQSDYDCADYPVTLQVYKFSTTTWEDLATNNTTTANNNFTLQKLGQATSGYVDGSNVLTCRVYQSAPSQTVQILYGSSAGNIVANSWYNFAGDNTPNSTQNSRYLYFPTAGRLQNLRGSLAASPGAGGGWTFTFFHNGSSTGCPVMTFDGDGGTPTLASDLTNYIDVVKGSLVELQTTVSKGAPTASWASWSIDFEPTVSGECVIFAGSGAGNLVTPGYMGPAAPGYATATQNQCQFIMPMNGTISKLYAHLNTATGAGNTRTFAIQLDAEGDSAVAFTINNPDVTGDSGANTVAVTAGQLVTISAAGTTPAASKVQASFVVVPSTLGDFPIGMTAYNATPDITAARYNSLLGAFESNATVGNVKTPTSAFTAKAIYGRIVSAPGTDKHFVVGLYQNSGVVLSADLTGTNNPTTASNTGTISIVATDLICLVDTPSGNPTAGPLMISVLGYIAPA